MRRYLFPITACCIIAVCSCNKTDPQVIPDVEPEAKEFIAKKYNGFFVEELAKAYDIFVVEDALPTYVNVEGIQYGKGRYLAAACLLLKRIQQNPENWEEVEVDVPERMSWGGATQNNTFEQDSISIDALSWAADKIYEYGVKYGSLPNYCSFGQISCSGYGKDSTYTYNYDTPFKDGVKYIGNFISNDYGAALCRVFKYYKDNSILPDKVCTWGSDYLRKTNNCDTQSLVVLAARDAAIAGLGANATDRQKAEAIFAYARDAWEWENYSNTKKGSVGTVIEKSGNCCDLTHATLAMCRATGIPARYLHGQCYFLSGVIGHVIPEIFVDGRWWICDPSNNSCTFGQPNWKGMQTFNGRYNELPF